VESDVCCCGSVDLTALSGVPADAIEVGEYLLVGLKSFLTKLFVNAVPDLLPLNMSKTDFNCVHDVQGATLLLPQKTANHTVVSVLTHLVLGSGEVV